jgi:hypothetical protein
MAEIFKISGLDKLEDILSKISDGLSSIEKSDGQPIIKDGGTIKQDIQIKTDRLSKTNSEAVKEYEYLESRKKGEQFTTQDQDKINKYIRDYLETVGKGIFS